MNLEIGKYRLESVGESYCVFEDGRHIIFNGTLPNALIFLGNKLKEATDG